MKVALKDNVDLRLIVQAIYSQPNQGVEELRMFDKAMNALEDVAHIEYSETGDALLLQPHPSRPDLPLLDDDGRPHELSYLREQPAEADFRGCLAWMQARLSRCQWGGVHSRRALALLERFGVEA